MKKYYLLLLSIILISCSSSDDNSGESQTIIIGKWDLKERMVGPLTTPLDPCGEQYSQYEFFGNKTSIETESYNNSDTACVFFIGNETYNITNNILTTKEDNGSYQIEERYYILELSPTKLKLKNFYYKGVYNGNVDEEFFSEGNQTTTTFEKI